MPDQESECCGPKTRSISEEPAGLAKTRLQRGEMILQNFERMVSPVMKVCRVIDSQERETDIDSYRHTRILRHLLVVRNYLLHRYKRIPYTDNLFVDFLVGMPMELGLARERSRPLYRRRAVLRKVPQSLLFRSDLFKEVLEGRRTAFQCTITVAGRTSGGAENGEAMATEPVPVGRFGLEDCTTTLPFRRPAGTLRETSPTAKVGDVLAARVEVGKPAATGSLARSSSCGSVDRATGTALAPPTC